MNSPIKHVKDLPLLFRQQIYDTLKGDKDTLLDESKVNLESSIRSENGCNFTIVLSSPKSMHLIFRLNCIQLETGEPIEDKMLVTCIPRNNIEVLLDE